MTPNPRKRAASPTPSEASRKKMKDTNAISRSGMATPAWSKEPSGSAESPRRSGEMLKEVSTAPFNFKKRPASLDISESTRKRAKNNATISDPDRTILPNSKKRPSSAESSERPRKKVKASPSEKPPVNLPENPTSSADTSTNDSAKKSVQSSIRSPTTNYLGNSTNNQIRPSASINDLPAELLQNVMKNLVQEDSMSLTLDLRLVSRESSFSSFIRCFYSANKSPFPPDQNLFRLGKFDVEIVAELFWVGALDNHVSHIPSDWLIRLLSSNAMSKHHARTNTFIQTIREVIRAVSRYYKNQSQKDGESISTAVCHLAVEYMNKRDLVKAFNDEDSNWLLSHEDVNKAALCVAGWLNDFNLYAHFESLIPPSLAPPTALSYFGTPAWAAARQGHVDFLARLRSQGYYFNAFEADEKKAALVAACQIGGETGERAAILIMEALLGSPFPCYHAHMETVVQFATKRRSFKLFNLLTEKEVKGHNIIFLEKALVEECDSLERNGIYEGTTKILEYLLERGVDPDISTVYNRTRSGSWNTNPNTTPLQDAVMTRNHPLVELFLKHGANPDRAYAWKIGRPIDIALWQKNPQMVDILLSGGAAKYGKDPIANKSFNILLNKDAWDDLPTFRAALSHFHPQLNQGDDEHAYEALLEATRLNRIDIIRAVAAAGCSIHGRWDPPLPAYVEQNDSQYPTHLPVDASLLRPRAVVKEPAIWCAQGEGNREAEGLLLQLGAVHNYPYDLLVRRRRQEKRSF